ncbi:glutathione S-transferase [Marchantia polymorpha subsp. ruderalis]
MSEIRTVAQIPTRLLTTKVSFFGCRVEIALREKGIPFSRDEVDLNCKPKLLLDLNPIYKKVPVVIHDGKAIAESLIILEYLEEVFPEVPLYPKEPFERANVRFWIDYMYKAFHSMHAAMMYRKGSLERIAAADHSMEGLRKIDETMTTLSADGPFFSGTEFSILDVVLAPLVTALTSIDALGGITLPGFDECPRLHKWIGFMQTHPSFLASLPSSDVVFKYLKNLARITMAAAASERVPIKF